MIECIYKRGHLFIRSMNKEVHQKRETRWNETYEKILEQTGTGEWTNIDKQLCVVTGGGLSIGEFYNSTHIFHSFLSLRKKAVKFWFERTRTPWRRGLVESSSPGAEEIGAMGREIESRQGIEW
jgi:hypothetical protein